MIDAGNYDEEIIRKVTYYFEKIGERNIQEIKTSGKASLSFKVYDILRAMAFYDNV